MEQDSTMMIGNTFDHNIDQCKLLGLPLEMLELLFSFVPFRESYNFRVCNSHLQSAFLNYFRRVFREYLSNYNDHLRDKFQLIESDDDYRERYNKEFDRIQNEFNCQVPFLLKELLIMTKHIDAEMNTAEYSYYSYPVHWFNPIKLWKREKNLVNIGDNMVLIPTGKCNNLIFYTNTKMDLWKSLFSPFSSMFEIKPDSFKKHCKIGCGRSLLSTITGVTSAPLALCMLRHYTVVDISPQQIAKVIAAISQELYHDRNFLVKAANIYYKIGKEIPQSLFEDRKFCLKLVKSHGKMLKYCTKFVNDKEIVSEAVKQNGYAIKYLSSQYLKSCPEIFELAISSKPYALDYIPTSTPGYRKLVFKSLLGMKEISVIPNCLNNYEMLQDKEVVETLLMRNPSLITYLPDMWKECRPLARKIISKDPYAISHFSNKVKQDARIIQLVVNSNPSVLFSFERETRQIQEILFKAWGLPPINQNNYDESMSKILELARKNPDIYTAVLNLTTLDYVPNNLRDKWCMIFYKEAVPHNSSALSCQRMKDFIARVGVKEQEEILKLFLQNPKPISSYYFYGFNRELKNKYALEACKKGVSLYDGSCILVTDPDDIVMCAAGKTQSILCFSEESYKVNTALGY